MWGGARRLVDMCDTWQQTSRRHYCVYWGRWTPWVDLSRIVTIRGGADGSVQLMAEHLFFFCFFFFFMQRTELPLPTWLTSSTLLLVLAGYARSSTRSIDDHTPCLPLISATRSESHRLSAA